MNRLKAALRSFGSWLVDAGLRADDPCGGLDIRRTTRRSPSWLADPERKRMSRELASRKGAAAERDRVMLQVLLGTGIRLAELVGLDVGSVPGTPAASSLRPEGLSGHVLAPLRFGLARSLRAQGKDIAAIGRKG